MTLLSLDPFAKIYSAIPKIACKGLCHVTCGPILMQQTEYERIERVRKFPDDPAPSLQCGQLGEDHRCLVYDARPLICRLWGVVEAPNMLCTHGCEREGTLTDQEARALINAVRQLDPRTRAGNAYTDRLAAHLSGEP